MFSYPILLSDSQKVIGNFRLFSFEISGTVSRSKKHLMKLGLRAYWENRLLATESNCADARGFLSSEFLKPASVKTDYAQM